MHVLLPFDAGPLRILHAARQLRGLGFAVRAERRALVGESDAIGVQDARRILRALGFSDREFRIGLDTERPPGAP
jgi:hypothetical protein